MNLNEDDLRLFYKLHPSLLLYTNMQLNIVKEIDSLSALMRSDLKLKKEIRDSLYEESDIIDSFISENPFEFNLEEISVIRNWKYFIKDSFIVFNHYKNYSAFYESGEPGKVYAVLGLTDPLHLIIPHTPAYVETVLLPFKEVIIYDGIVAPYSISFGRNIRYSLKDSYDQAKAIWGVIKKIPFEKPSESETNQGLLKYYLKDEEFYKDRIDNLIANDEKIKELYFQEIGKKNAKNYKRKLQEYNINDCWFVLLGDMIVASGKTREEAESSAHRIVLKKQENLLYYFQIH